MSGAAYWDCPACGSRFHESLVSEHWDHLVERVKVAEAADWDSHYEAHTKAQVQLTALEAERDQLIERVKEAETSAKDDRKSRNKWRARALHLRARLRAAEEVVTTTRTLRGFVEDVRRESPEASGVAWDVLEPLFEALSHYDEAVKE